MLKILGIGDNVIEKYPQTKVMYPGGNIVNFCVFARQLGHRASFLGSFGSDLAAMHMKKILMDMDIDISKSRNYLGRSREAEVNIINGDRFFLNTLEEEANALNKVTLTEEECFDFKKFDVIHTDIISHMDHQLEKIAKYNPMISFDFSDRWNKENLKQLCPHIYFSFLSCDNHSIDEIEAILTYAYQSGSPLCLAGMGEKGAMLFDGTKFYRRKAIDIQVIDTLGAGSAFLTSFITELLSKCKKENTDLLNMNPSIKQDILDESLSSAIFFAAKTCEQDGPFGYPMDLLEDEKVINPSTISKNIVMGVIGADVHAVGNKILEYAFKEAGFQVTNLGVMVSQEEFVHAAIETDADVIIVSSLYGHGELDCIGLREKCTEAGLDDILLYVGGNLVVGVQDFSVVEKKFLEMGFNRVYSNKATAQDDIEDLKKDLHLV